jgi:hypothetical protein
MAADGVRLSSITERTGVGDSMTVKIQVKRKVKVNGKEYASREEVPENIREAYDKALANAISGHSASPGAPTTKIVFNGQEYASVDSMPDEIRQAFEEALSAARGVEAGDSDLLRGRTRMAETILTQHGHTDWAFSDKAIEPGSSTFSSQRLLVIGFLVLALLCALYFIFRES